VVEGDEMLVLPSMQEPPGADRGAAESGQESRAQRTPWQWSASIRLIGRGGVGGQISRVAAAGAFAGVAGVRGVHRFSLIASG
jgi:hypothetical protein